MLRLPPTSFFVISLFWNPFFWTSFLPLRIQSHPMHKQNVKIARISKMLRVKLFLNSSDLSKYVVIKY